MTDLENVESLLQFIKTDLRKYVGLFINDKDFVKDIEKSKIFNSFENLTIDKRIKMVDNYLGNTARTNILARLVLKHLYRLAIKSEDLFLDLYWKAKIKDI